MSKELLEETENKMVEFRQLLALVTGHNDILNKAAHIHEIVIEQAERVEELEKVEYALQETYRQEREYSKKLEQQNKYYREIIQDFIDYADDYNIAKVEKYHLRKALESEE